MNFKDWYNSTLANEHNTDKLIAAEHGWDACRTEMLKILDNPKSWEYIDNETEALTEKALNKLRNL
jgi:hypothetical protein